MAYSIEFSRAISIGLFINMKMNEFSLEYVPTKVIAEYLKIPAPTVVRILKSLNSAGITAAKEGAKGGVILAKPIAEITLLDIFLAIEQGPLFKVEINFLVEHPQVDSLKTVINNCMKDAEDSMKESLRKTTLAALFYLSRKE